MLIAEVRSRDQNHGQNWHPNGTFQALSKPALVEADNFYRSIPSSGALLLLATIGSPLVVNLLLQALAEYGA